MIEILAPAGSYECALSAINAGAQAIYLGLDKFSARSSAENFNDENFKNICDYAHVLGVKVYVALNTIIKENEINSFLQSVFYAWNNGADAIIMQDIFLGKYIKSKYPKIKLHLSTQAGTCNKYGAILAREYGFDRVILARETKFEDIKEIAKIIETEVFVQGALCTCFSGQCYMSSFIGGNSGNRGKCKQPCRKLYSLDRKGFEEKAYRLSLSDLCVGEKIKELIDAGVVSFKIEGRMRRPEYVAAAVEYYKNILENRESSKDLSNLKRTYNRGNYTDGLAFGQDKSFISAAVQGHIGEYAGVISVQNKKYICITNQTFDAGCGFKILRNGLEVGGGRFGGSVKEGCIIDTADRLKNGDKVFITTDSALNNKLLTTKKLLPVKVDISLLFGECAKATINGITIQDTIPLEKAQNSPLSKEDIVRCFSKVENYPFEVTCRVQTDGVFLAISSLNSFRRKVFAKYYEVLTTNKNQEIQPVIYTQNKTDKISLKRQKSAVISTDLRGVKADIGILKLSSFSQNIAKLSEEFAGEKYLYLPAYLTGEEVKKAVDLVKGFDGIYCEGYYGIALSKILNKPLFAGCGFNITNSISLDECNAKYIAISKELTISESVPIMDDSAFYLSEGNIKVMDLIYCPFEKKCASCDKRDIYTLTDSDNRQFSLRRYTASECRFEVFNCFDLIPTQTKCNKLIDNTLKGININKKTHGHTITGVY